MGITPSVAFLTLSFAFQGAPPASLPAPATAPAPPAPIYETHWVWGTPFSVGAMPAHQVWITWQVARGAVFAGGSEPHLIVSVVNQGPAPVAFDAAAIRIWERGERGDKPLRVYSAVDYERRLRSQRAMMSSLRTASLSDQPQVGPPGVYGANSPPVGNVQQPVGKYPPNTKMMGEGSSMPDQISQAGTSLNGTFVSLASTLLGSRTLDAGTTYGGAVFFAQTKAERLRVEVKVGGDDFVFELSRPQ